MVKLVAGLLSMDGKPTSNAVSMSWANPLLSCKSSIVVAISLGLLDVSIMVSVAWSEGTLVRSVSVSAKDISP